MNQSSPYAHEHEAIEQLYTENVSKKNIAAILIARFRYTGAEADIERVRKRVSKYIHRKLQPAALIPAPEPKPERQTVSQNLTPDTFMLPWEGNTLIRFALVSDTHLNSKYTQITHLHRFYDICEQRGIDTYFHVGDIDEGEQMRPGHQYECYTQGADEHVTEICRVYPQKPGATTYFITGNHDASMIKRAGYNIGTTIATKRPDMVYLGSDCAIVQLTPNCTLELRHPWDGSSYAISYKSQKILDAIPGGEKPNIMAIGHYHKAEYICYRNVHCFQAGTFCAQTPFMRGKSISAMMGGWIIEVAVSEDGSIRAIRPEFIPFYKAIPDDYKNWRER